MFHAGQDGPDGPEAHPVAESAARWARFTFIVLFVMNLLDYTDRWVLSAVLEDIQRDFHLSNYKGGLLATYFLVSYSLISPIMGWLGDRMRRTWLLGIGVGIWSLATVGTGLAQDYGHLALA
ncbi:MAG TPA: MFS transporter, partial [Isosphaeraceae bacterium]